MKPDHIHVGHRGRLKSKYIRAGLDAFESHEVLEFLLTYAIPQKDVNPLAHELIKKFGTLNGVLDASVSQLKEVPGIGEHAAVLITMIPQLAKRYLNAPELMNLYSLARESDRVSYFIPKFVGAEEECLYVAFLNKKLEVLSCELIDRGSVDMIQLETRRLIDAAVRFKSSVVIIAHNHFGSVAASMADITATNNLAQKLAYCGITLLDHIVVCRDRGISLAAERKFTRVI